MWCCLHVRSTCSHVSGSGELHMGHVIDGKASLLKNSCFMAFPYIGHVLFLEGMYLRVSYVFVCPNFI